MFFKINDLIKLRLHRDYELSKIFNKLKQQFAKSFKIIKRIERLTYRLKLLFKMKIYNVISITQLKPITNFISNLYERRLLSPPLNILNNENEIKRLIRKRNRYIKRLKNKITKYLVR